MRSFASQLLLLAVSWVIGLPSAFAWFGQDDLLEPEKAFQISTRPLDERTVEVRFRIADGYYMYRDRFKFETADGRVVADVELPPGKVKKDPFFGETQTYRREAVIRVPVGANDVAPGRVKLKVTSQGCADSGVCFVPLEQTVDVSLSAVRPATGSAGLTQSRSFVVPSWAQALLGAFALTAFVLSLRFVPALGVWRSRVRAVRWLYPGIAFGFAALLILAAYPLLAQPVRELAWGALLVMLAVWLRAIDPLPHAAGRLPRLGKGIGVLALAGGIVLLAFAAGWRSPLHSDSASGVQVGQEPPRFERIANIQDLEARLRGTTRPTMLDFYADWCVTCKEMERFTFSDPAVRARMQSNAAAAGGCDPQHRG
jgi:thiol:disulfide interchange protein